MTAGRSIKTLTVLASAALVVTSMLAGTADAKKKKPKTPPPPPACAAYEPGEEGAEAKTTVVTDAATAEAPIVLDLTAGPGLTSDLTGEHLYDETTSIYQNIQVDTANTNAGLYVKFEFPEYHDYDLYLNNPDGTTAANSGEFNAAVAVGESLGGGSPEGAWEAGTDYESVLGINTEDCRGYTAKMVSFLTNGGAVKLSMWLGPVVADPAA